MIDVNTDQSEGQITAGPSDADFRYVIAAGHTLPAVSFLKVTISFI